MENFKELLFKYKTILAAVITWLSSIMGFSDQLVNVVSSTPDNAVISSAVVVFFFAVIRETLKALGKEVKI